MQHYELKDEWKKVLLVFGFVPIGTVLTIDDICNDTEYDYAKAGVYIKALISRGMLRIVNAQNYIITDTGLEELEGLI